MSHTQTDTTPAAIEALLKDVTPGPWGMETVRSVCGVCHKIGPWPHQWRHGADMSACIYDDYPSPPDGTGAMLANARFIAAARDLVPALAAELATARDLFELSKLTTEAVLDRAVKAETERAALRKEVERLREALTPSGDTKAAYIGEVKMQVSALIEDDDGELVETTHAVPVDWTATKETMAMILKRATLTAEPLGHGITADDFGGEA